MSEKIALDALWNALSPEEQADACLAFWQASDPLTKKTQPRAIVLLAIALRFRPMFLSRRKPEDLAKHLLRFIGQKALRPLRQNVLVAWTLMRREKLVSRFLDVQSIPHKNGIIDDDVIAPSTTSFRSALGAIHYEFPNRDQALYLGLAMLDGGDFWRSLPEALAAEHFDILAYLAPILKLSVEPTETANTEEGLETLPEDNEDFTTLDNLLIRTAVASAFHEEGSLTQTQVEDLVDEAVELNASRQRTLFHRGFTHSIFGKELSFNFRGENEERRMWYFTGVIFGFLRLSSPIQCIEILKRDENLTARLCENTKIKCGPMVLPHLYPLLFEAEEYGLLQSLITAQTERIETPKRMKLLNRINADAASLLRKGSWIEASLFLDCVNAELGSEDLPTDFVNYLRPINERKRAQTLQLQGDFMRAEQIISPLLELQTFEDLPNALCDFALIRGGFRSLQSILPITGESAAQEIRDCLDNVQQIFHGAIDRFGPDATNAHLCLGVLSLLRGVNNSNIASDHLKHSLLGMLKKEAAYQEGGLIHWTVFLLGVTMLELADPIESRYARNRIERSIECPIEYPLWLWERALKAAALFDDSSLAQMIADYVLTHRGRAAFETLWNAGLPFTYPALRGTYLEWLLTEKRPVDELWNQLSALLPTAIRDGSGAQAEQILDALEGLANQGGQYREEFIHLLESPAKYSPAWDIIDSENARIRCYEQKGDFAQATELLRNQFYRLRQTGDERSTSEAAAVIEQIATYHQQHEHLDEMRQLLQADHLPFDECETSLDRDTHVLILSIGGSETQELYERAIRAELTFEYPGLVLEFYFPGWSSRWNLELQKIKPKILQADAVVLSTLVRTIFGRHVRSLCNSDTPWFPCTGRGKQAIRSSIEKAVIWALKRKTLALSST